MKPNDIEFLMHAMNCLNSSDKEVVNAFRNSKDNINRLAELAKADKDALLSTIDKLKGLTS
jgi:hypothetical protein